MSPYDASIKLLPVAFNVPNANSGAAVLSGVCCPDGADYNSVRHCLLSLTSLSLMLSLMSSAIHSLPSSPADRQALHAERSVGCVRQGDEGWVCWRACSRLPELDKSQEVFPVPVRWCGPNTAVQQLFLSHLCTDHGSPVESLTLAWRQSRTSVFVRGAGVERDFPGGRR